MPEIDKSEECEHSDAKIVFVPYYFGIEYWSSKVTKFAVKYSPVRSY